MYLYISVVYSPYYYYTHLCTLPIIIIHTCILSLLLLYTLDIITVMANANIYILASQKCMPVAIYLQRHVCVTSMQLPLSSQEMSNSIIATLIGIAPPSVVITYLAHLLNLFLITTLEFSFYELMLWLPLDTS